MSLTPGASIAHYRITAKLGEGGMGAVYRATDTKLHRDVAIKVLPDALAGEADRLTRLTREAHVLASLNHPNIAAIYGIEERALVLELVTGAEPRGPLTEAEALPLIHQLIDALEYAHDRGVVHRDLKPANLKITREGQLKVLDFGLAKAVAPEATEPNPVSSLTLTMRATMAGAIMGTAAYMSPEQARGQDTDRRADIWAFGAVVYELLTGRVLFDGKTVSDTLAAVLTRDPDVSAAPPRFRRLFRLCLERDVRQRLSHISAARLLLDEPERPTAPGQRPSRISWIAAGLALAAAFLFAFLWMGTTRRSHPLVRFRVELGPDAIDGPQMTALLSPDGRHILYRASSPNGFVLALRALDQPSGAILPGTEGASFAFFSPDSAWIGFFATGQLKKIAVSGGAPVTLCDASDPHGATWLPDGTIVGVLNGFDLSRVSSAGGVPQRLYQAGVVPRYPQALPGGDDILFTNAPQGTLDFNNANIEVLSIKSGQRKTILRGAYFARYAPTGHLVWIQGNTIYGARFAPSKTEIQGAAVPLFESISTLSAIGAGHFDFSNDGSFVYVTGTNYGSDQRLMVFDSAGGEQVLPGAFGASIKLSPDGKRLAYSSKGDLAVYDFDRKASTRLTFDASASNRHATWSPDGEHIAFARTGGVYWIRADGSSQAVRIIESDQNPPNPWSMIPGEAPGRVRLAIHASAPEHRGRDIYVVPLDITNPDRPVAGKPEPFLVSPASEMEPTFSPDGHWMAYSVQNGQDLASKRLYVRRYRPGAAAGGGQWQISDSVASYPVWSANGREIVFRNATANVMSVEYTVHGDTIAISQPRQWSLPQIYLTPFFRDFDLFPDGRRIIAMSLPEETKGGAIRPHVNVLLNFFDELKRRLP